MPGMMDTILNLGLNDEAVEGFAKKTGNPRFAYDSYRRFIQMFSDVVKEVDKAKFEDVLDDIKAEKGVKFDTDLDADDLKEVIKRYKGIYRKALNEEFPQDPKDQLFEAIKAVFRSWDNPRAIYYRRMNDIPGDWEQLLTFRQWYLVTWEIHQEQVWHLQETHLQVRNRSTENT